MTRRLRREIRVLRYWAFATTMLLLVSSVAVFSQTARGGTRFDEITVERINVVERDGSVRLVIANGTRQADAVIDGRVIVPGSTRAPGMIFFNELGDEVGGLIFSGRMRDGQPRATGSLTFDQFKQDQTVALQYVEENGRRRAGLAVIDRPQTSLRAVVERNERLAAVSSEQERTAIQQEMARDRSAQRMFVGKDLDGRATLALSDAQGRPRLQLSVAADGAATIAFLDASGNVVREVRP